MGLPSRCAPNPLQALIRSSSNLIDQEPAPAPTKFGELVTCDHMVTRALRMEGCLGEANAFFLKEIKTGSLWGYLVSTKSADEVSQSLQHFVGRRKLVTLYSDNAREIISVAKGIADQHETSCVGLPQNSAFGTHQSGHHRRHLRTLGAVWLAGMFLVVRRRMLLSALQCSRTWV